MRNGAPRRALGDHQKANTSGIGFGYACVGPSADHCGPSGNNFVLTHAITFSGTVMPFALRQRLESSRQKRGGNRGVGVAVAG